MLGWRFYFCVTKIFSNFLTFRWRGLYSGICQSDFYDWVFLPVKILWCRQSIGLELTLILLSARTYSHIIRNVETCPASSNPPQTRAHICHEYQELCIFVEKKLSCGETSAFYTEFEQFMEFYHRLCRFCSKSMWRKICAEKICVEKKWQIRGLGSTERNCEAFPHPRKPG